ncbi:MAG TPA: prolipoprotein diacylglyceryl transferase [Verrucomicrobiae bacterium]|jgi:phosphatidylglycerol:prolipoprotein diacylglycerol transferase|nr:prolipoprotein diacylglyceryl transferase [Verrucomicrobiae bacterium]
MKPALLLYPHISSYPVLLLFGFFFGWALARRRTRLFKIDPKHLDNIILILPLASLFGARFFARLFYAKVGFVAALKFWEGDGLVFYGGFLFGASSVLAYALSRRINLISLCDCVAPSVALGLAFGRVGCFLAGCCWGDLCVDSARLHNISDARVMAQIYTLPAVSGGSWPFAVRFPAGSDTFKQHVKYGLISKSDEASLPVHPVQLYEAAAAALLAAFLHFRIRRNNPGDTALALLLGYAAIRFGTEYLRADNKAFGWSLTFSQLVSVEIAITAMILWTIRSLILSRANRDPHEASKTADRVEPSGSF